MSQQVNETIEVLAAFYGKDAPLVPLKFRWQAKDYILKKPDFYHPTKDGYHTVHHFSLTDIDEQTYFKIAFHSGRLQWTLEEYEPCQ